MTQSRLCEFDTDQWAKPLLQMYQKEEATRSLLRLPIEPCLEDGTLLPKPSINAMSSFYTLTFIKRLEPRA